MDIAKLIATIVSLLTGTDSAKWANIFQLVLEGKNPFPVPPVHKIWKTIEIGAHTCKCGLLSMLAGFVVTDWAKDIIGKDAFVLSKVKRSLDLVLYSVAEMGFVNGATNQQIWDWARANGLDLCPAELAPYLRAQYTDQPLGEWLIIAMEAITASGRNPSVLRVGRNSDGPCLGGDLGNPDSFRSASRRFVFVLRK